MKQKNQIFDIIRICAALMVFTVHFFMFVEAPDKLASFTAGFSSGVALFFVISGYLMMQSLDRCQNIGEYFRKRVIRIVPSYYAILVIGILVWDILLKQMPADELGLGWLRYFLFLNTIVPARDYYKWNDLWGLWTLSCFMVFYLAAPILKRVIKNYTQSIVFLLLSIAGGYACSYLMEYVLVGMGYHDAYIIASDSPWFNLNVFAVGMSLWYAVSEKKEKNFAGICALIIFVLFLFEKQNRVGFGCATAVIIIGFFNAAFRQQWIVHTIDVLSRYSFPFYLVHLGVMEILGVMRERGIIDNNIIFALLVIVISVVAAVMLYHLVEQPVAMLAARKERGGNGQ